MPADLTEIKISETIAIVLDVMLDDPKAEHYASAIAEVTGKYDSVVRNALIRLNKAGWCSARKEAHNPKGRAARVLYQFTDAGRRAAAAEVKQWDIKRA